MTAEANTETGDNVKPIGGGQGKRDTFDRDMLEAVQSAYESIGDLKAQRSGINESIQAEFSRLEGMGFNKKALKAAFTFIDMDDDKRLNWDNTMVFARQACNQPLQPDLFQASMTAKFAKLDEEPKPH